jgi:hypothetical protein
MQDENAKQTNRAAWGQRLAERRRDSSWGRRESELPEVKKKKTCVYKYNPYSMNKFNLKRAVQATF